MKYYRTILGAAIVVVGLVLPARAGLIVTVSIGNTTMLPGGTGTMDVMMTGVDKLQNFNLDFTITSSWPGLVTFTPPAGPEPFTDSANYVFKGDSAVWEFSSFFFGVPTATTINGADATSIGDNVVIDPDSSKLVATLYLTASPTAMAGQWAAIALDPANPPAFTYFDGDTNQVTYDYSSTGGVVTIGAAVPEPSSIGLFLGILGVGSVVTRYRARRRRKSQTTDNVLPLESASL
jgi:hypothetical protein